MPTNDQCILIDAYAAEGQSHRQIAAAVGVGKSTVGRYLQRNILIPPSEDWGLGAAKQVRRSTKEETETVVFLSDFHVPHHDIEAVDSALKLIQDIRPHRVVINGDLPDFHGISEHDPGLSRLDSLQSELDQANAIRRAIRQAAPDALLDETEGNHDARLRVFVQLHARALLSLDALKPAALNAWDELEITPHGSNGFLLRPNFLVRHGTVARGEGGASAKAELLAAGISGASGHTHRLARYRRDGYTVREWSEGGCLCKLTPDYIKGDVPNWQHGLLVGHFSTSSDAFVVDHVQTLNSRFIYGGRTY